MIKYQCLCYNPVEWQSLGIAIASLRAGGVAVLCAAHGGEEILSQKLRVLQQRVGSDGAKRLGVRLDITTASAQEGVFLCELIEANPAFVIVSPGFGPPDLSGATSVLSAILSSRPVLWEVCSAPSMALTRRLVPRVDAWILCGEEAGGASGSLSTPLFLQSVVRHPPEEPLIVRGGFGYRGAAALLGAGADGVVIDDQALLLKESPWSEHNCPFMAQLDGQESILLGDAYQAGYRFLNRPEFPMARRLFDAFRDLESTEKTEVQVAEDWHRLIRPALRWRLDTQSVWPAGQAIGLAQQVAREFRTIGRFVQALTRSVSRVIEETKGLGPFQPGAPLAKSHGTRYPTVQGPMTRVSDQPAFARAVAQAGGLPFQALALLREETATTLLKETAAKLGVMPWGVGILGFVPPELRKEQIRAIIAARAPFALIAGGRPDQARELESHGIRTYLHTPTAALLSSFIKQGARRFILEGRESGGHVGPLGSLGLWEQGIQVLLNEIPPGEDANVHVLFAGGIHDARSAGIAATFAAALAKRGIRVGILMGTAYIFTEEAVATEAIVESFQKVVLSCGETIALESGGGHANRCAKTPFAAEFSLRRRFLLRSRNSPEQIREDLDKLGLGRLRLATKGIVRNNQGALERIQEDEKIAKGMYMIGQAASIRDKVQTVAELHADVCRPAEPANVLSSCPLLTSGQEVYAPAPSDIAIIGISCILPGAQSPDAFWHNLLQKRLCIQEIPKNHFDWRLYFDSDKNAKDKIYSRWGGFIDDLQIDPLSFGIPPKSLKALSPVQLLALETARRAMVDAGLDAIEFDRDNTEVIVANSEGGGFLEDLLTVRIILPLLIGKLPADIEELLPEWTGEAFTGMLNNIAAGRIANRFDLGGANFTVDAACAASLTAVDAAVKDLETHRCNLALVGATDCANSPGSYIGFSKTQALSSDGSVRTFDVSANGIVISEGAAFVVLKRVQDAERDGDRIYCVIKSVAGSSDGKGLGLTAPSSQGQLKALQRAYRKAGFHADTVELYEAHGTGTSLGDKTEVETIIAHLKTGKPAFKCIVGSHKTLIGHTKTSAGLVGLIKAALALYYKTLPPHAGVSQPLEAFAQSNCPVALIDHLKPWLSNGRTPRRSGVSGFGFGGTNSHAVLEEYSGAAISPPLGGCQWPCELFVLRARDRQGLASSIGSLLSSWKRFPDILHLAASIHTDWIRASQSGPSVSFVVASLEEARDILSQLRESLTGNGQVPPGVFFKDAQDPITRSKVAVLFPGQGSQYVGMLREPATYIAELHYLLEKCDRILESRPAERLSDKIFPNQAFNQELFQKQAEELGNSYYAQPALAVASIGLLEFLRSLGFEPDLVAGHSFGELTALCAAGCFSQEEFIQFAERRGRIMSQAGNGTGAMAALLCSEELVIELIETVPGLSVANINAPQQRVVAGKTESVQQLIVECRRRGIAAKRLPVGGAFHSPEMLAAIEPLRAEINRLNLSSPRLRILAGDDGQPYPLASDEIRAKIESQLVTPVRFMSLVESLYTEGARIFIEVGPNQILSGLLAQCLKPNSHRSIALDNGTGKLAPLLQGIGVLACLGKLQSLSPLWEKRMRQASREILESNNSSGKYFMNGMFVWSESDRHYGKKALPDTDKMKETKKPLSVPPEVPPIASESIPDFRTDPELAAYSAYQTTMREFLKTQEKVMSALLGREFVAEIPEIQSTAVNLPGLNNPPAVIDTTSLDDSIPSANERTSEHPIRAPSETSNTSNPNGAESNADVPVPQIDQQRLLDLLVSAVSNVTGYPADMLAPDRDIESELGIDSIKRFEIINSFINSLPPQFASRLSNDLDNLAREKSLNAIVARIVQGPEAPTPDMAAAVSKEQAVALDEDRGANSAEQAEAGCPRFIMQSAPQPALPAAGLLHGFIVVLPDERGTAELLCRRLNEAGAQAHQFPLIETGVEIESWLQTMRARFGIVRAVVQLAGLESESTFPASLHEWRTRTFRNVKLLFRWLKAVQGDLVTNENGFGRVMAASLMGGQFGRNSFPASVDPISASCLGLLRTFQLENPVVIAKMVDLDPSLQPEALSDLLFQELSQPGDRVEVGYPRGERTIFEVVSQELPDAADPIAPFDEKTVLVAIGGARGISAEFLRRFAVPGMNLVLVGRSEIQEEHEETADLTTEEDLRNHFIRKHDGTLDRPALIERKITGILNSRARRNTLTSLRKLGVNVYYRTADVRDEEAVRKLLEGIYGDFGQIHILMHGPGIISDRLVIDKTAEVFDEVFDTKADSAFLVMKYLRPEFLKRVIFFASAAGRFGNAGQADYAAGNELLNRMAWVLHRKWPSCRVLSVNWGPWAEAGMATAAVNRKFLQRKISPIPTEAGCRFLAKEISSGLPSDVEIIAGDGPWNSGRSHPVKKVFELGKLMLQAS